MSRVLRPNYDQMFLLPPSLEEWIAPEHPVRFVRDLVDMLDLSALGFREPEGERGRPPYGSDVLLKVWVFSWMERVRTSRRLEKACLRDVAFVWLTGNLHPDHTTLARFFSSNRKAMQPLFKRVVQLATRTGLVGFALHALDGTKMQAASSTDTALHRKRLEEQLQRLDALVETQMKEAEQAETEEADSYAMPEEMKDPTKRRAEICAAMARLDKEERKHLHPNEPEARMMKGRNLRALGYNAQIVVDHDSDLIVAADVVVDETDHAQLVPMIEQTVQMLGAPADQTVADTGYYGGTSIDEAERKHLPVLVGMQKEAPTKGDYAKSRFQYDAERDVYRCPRGELLPLERERKPTSQRGYIAKVYRCHNGDCPARADCTNDKQGRSIERSPFDDALLRQAQKQQEPAMQVLMSLRKEIVEHLFGCLKGNDGFRRFTVRGLEKVKAQWSLACAAVNLRKLSDLWTRGVLIWRQGQLLPA